MFNSALLDVFIGLALIYVLLSLVVASIIEMIAGLAKFRNNLLEAAMTQILEEKKYVNLFYNHPLISCFGKKPFFLTLIYKLHNWSVARKLKLDWIIKKLNLIDLYTIIASGRPSYLSSKLFAQIMHDLLSGGYEGIKKRYQPIMKPCPPAAAQVPDEECFVLQFNELVTYRKDEVEKWLKRFGYFVEQEQVVECLADWYDIQMERVTGKYKRKTQGILFLVSLVFCMFLNADSLMMVNILWSDPVMREAAVYEATKTVRGADGDGGDEEHTADAMNRGDDTHSPCMGCTKLTPLEIAAKSTMERPFPVGWQEQKSAVYREFRAYPENFKEWCYKVLGIFITTFLISLGAPFWFDILSKFVNIRNVGLRPKNASVSPNDVKGSRG